MNKPRILILYTSNYLMTPFKVVYDGSTSKVCLDKVEAKYQKQAKTDEDAHLTIVRVSKELSNKDVLNFYNNTMELMSNHKAKKMDEDLQRRRMVKKFIEDYVKIETEFFKQWLKKSL